MNCPYSTEQLALFISEDLPPSRLQKVARHVTQCPACQELCDQMRETQSLFKSLRQGPVSSADLAAMRQSIWSHIDTGQARLSWMVKFERFLLVTFGRHRYAYAGVAVVAILSISLLAQVRRIEPVVIKAAATFEGNGVLLRPEGYREWIAAGSSAGHGQPEGHADEKTSWADPFRSVYIDRSSYRQFVQTGQFPDGTVMVLEVAKSDMNRELLALDVSVKDSKKFAGGWGFFEFTDGAGTIRTRSAALPDEAGCRSCHAEGAETDHVFTQFYPALRPPGARS